MAKDLLGPEADFIIPDNDTLGTWLIFLPGRSLLPRGIIDTWRSIVQDRF